MAQQLYHYVSPLIYPLFHEDGATLSINLNLEHILAARAIVGFTGVLHVYLKVFVDGEELSKEEIDISVQDGTPSPSVLTREFTSSSVGYVEFGITADAAIFNRMFLSQGYGLLVRPGLEMMTIQPDIKYARDRIADQIARFKVFCLVHAANYVDPERNMGNSFLLINPYRQALVATLRSSKGNVTKKKVSACSAALVSLEDILVKGEWDTVMVTSTNRVTVYDIRHDHGEPMKINSIDHLEVYCSTPTIERLPVLKYARRTLGRIRRKISFGAVPDNQSNTL